MEDVGDRRFGEWTLRCGDAQDELAEMDDNSVQTVITSPPYYGLRDYGDIDTVWGGSKDCDHTWGDSIPGSNRGGSGTPTDKNGRGEGYGRNANRGVYCQSCGAWKGQLGREPLHDCGRPDGSLCSGCYVCHIVAVFRRVHDVLRSDGTVWLNIGDSYSSGGRTTQHHDSMHPDDRDEKGGRGSSRAPPLPDIKEKDLIGIPWRVALALQQDGWFLRSAITWAKGISGQDQIQSDLGAIMECHGVSSSTRKKILEDVTCHVGNVMPESVKDRPTQASEMVFLLTPSKDYFYDHIAIREDVRLDSLARMDRGRSESHKYAEENPGEQTLATAEGMEAAVHSAGRNRRDVWAINTRGYEDAHFAVMPPPLARPCIEAGTSERGACPECGAPFERVIEDTGHPDPSALDSPFDTEHTATHQKERMSKQTRTLKVPTGWQPTCTCSSDDEPVPCRVLDPFAGAGTTVMVADRLGREGVGIEIADKYVEMARGRIRADRRERLAPWESGFPDEDASDKDASDETMAWEAFTREGGSSS